MARVNLRQLKYFVTVVDAGNMTRAAEQLFVAQPALGMQIRQLEEDLGVARLHRHSRGVEPTTAGTLLRARAHAILRLVEETCQEVSAWGGEGTETIRLGMTPAIMMLVGPEPAVNVRERIPQVFLSLVGEMSHVLVDAVSRGTQARVAQRLQRGGRAGPCPYVVAACANAREEAPSRSACLGEA
jgi:LysR family nitrogen assimilation transcriptional regulator